MKDEDLKYVLVEANAMRDLAERVTDFLSKGWKLHGSPFVFTVEQNARTTAPVFVQALTRE